MQLQMSSLSLMYRSYSTCIKLVTHVLSTQPKHGRIHDASSAKHRPPEQQPQTTLSTVRAIMICNCDSICSHVSCGGMFAHFLSSVTMTRQILHHSFNNALALGVPVCERCQGILCVDPSLDASCTITGPV